MPAPSHHNTQLTHLAFLRAKPGQGDELGRRLRDLYEDSRAEPGNINYDLHRSIEDPLVWMVYENWRSEADLDLHFTFPYMKSFVAWGVWGRADLPGSADRPIHLP